MGQPLTERLLVRVAGADDVPGIRAVAESYGTLGEWPERPDYLDFELEESALSVALDGEEVVGFAGVLEHGGVAHLADLFVRNDRRGQGVGRVLLEAALLEADAAAAGRERGPELAFLQHAGAYGLTLPGGYAVVRAAAGEHGAVKLALFGPHPALGALLDAGFRITAADTYMASRLDALDTLEYLPSPELG